MRPRFYRAVDLFTSNSFLLMICLSYFDYRFEVVTLLHSLNREKRLLVENYDMMVKNTVYCEGDKILIPIHAFPVINSKKICTPRVGSQGDKHIP